MALLALSSAAASATPICLPRAGALSQKERMLDLPVAAMGWGKAGLPDSQSKKRPKQQVIYKCKKKFRTTTVDFLKIFIAYFITNIWP